MTIDILICSIDKGIVRTGDLLLPQRPDVRYIISYQYTDERYLDLIPTVVEERDDVSLYKWRGRGLSANRNLAVEKATGDILMFADDDTHIIPESLDKIIRIFERDPQLDVAFFSASTYTGKPLKQYPEKKASFRASLSRIPSPPSKWSRAVQACRGKYASTSVSVSEPNS